MPVKALPTKQEAFLDEYMTDYNATRAYMKVYSVTNVDTAAANACRLLRNDKVLDVLHRKQQRVRSRHEITIEKTIRELCYIAHEKPDVKDADRLKAVELAGKYLGIFRDRIEHTGKDGSDLQVVFNMPRPERK